MKNTKFYTELKKSKKPLAELLASDSDFLDVPQTWHVVVVDIQNSTQAVVDGNHHQVNLTATGSIISVLNTVRKFKQNIEIPYFFGGDGATFLIPSSLLDKVITVLDNYSVHIKIKTKLILRVGYVPVKDLLSKQCHLKIAKHQLTQRLTIPIILGNGLHKAEEIIKSNFKELSNSEFNRNLLNLEGMECRWEEVNPEQNKAKVVCLLLDAVKEEAQQDVYREVLTKMDDIFGSFTDRQPIKSERLKLDASLYKIWEEMKVSLADKNWFYFFKNWIKTNIGRAYFSLSKSGKQYLKQIGQLSHSFMLDGMINTIFTAEQDKIDLFIDYLDQLESEHKIKYGIHVTHASVMSCYVLDMKTSHSHFVDGTEGGYTSAAKMLKVKKKASPQ
ncbi:DUF3095 family protein [Maribacter sp. SA7]|uniref:DUF3095 family protein n=1 Tax=Maribacter zhoushanensis TaxID=3030012 RepID=UPI0023EB2135|nr:DUF3095 family protein [Maribacter zhoushanensis]MDF4203266.1 DUF3095 family protein [Maribacter zhoushanensis]